MPTPEFASVTTAAIVFTDQIAAFPDRLSASLRLNQPNQTNQPSQHPYLIIHNQERKSITIELVRELQTGAAFAIGENEQRELILLWADLITVPAQQALLKILEEPPARTRFWLVTDRPQALLETVRSRCVRLSLTGQNDHPNQQSADNPASLPRALQTVTIASLRPLSLSQLIELAAKPTDRNEAQRWCAQLLQHCRSTQPVSTIKVQQSLLLADERLQQNGNVRLVLEECLFTIKLLL